MAIESCLWAASTHEFTNSLYSVVMGFCVMHGGFMRGGLMLKYMQH